MQQARRVSQQVCFMALAELVEFGETEMIFTKATEKRTQDCIKGRFG